MEEQENKTPHDIYDRGYKLLLSFIKIFKQLIEGYVEGDWRTRLDYSKSQKVDKTFILEGLEKKETDVLYRVPLLGEQGKEAFIYVLIEQQSTVDYILGYRVSLYVWKIWEDFYKNTDENRRRQKGFRFPPIFPIVLYNGSGTWTATTELRNLVDQKEAFGDFIPNLKYYLIDVSHYDEEKLKQIGNSLAGVFLLEHERYSEEEFETAFKEAMEIIDKENDEELWKSIIHWITAKLKYEYPDKEREILETLDVDKHSRKEIRSMLETMPKKLIAWGEIKGHQQGRQEGRQEGMRDSIIEFLEARLEEVTPEIKDELCNVVQLQDLALLVKKAATVCSLQEFRLALTEIRKAHMEEKDI